MFKKLSPEIFLGYLIDHIREKTSIACYDSPENKQSPLYSVELTGIEPANTKTMYIDVYNVNIHSITAPIEPHSFSNTLKMVGLLNEALTDDLVLPDPFYVYDQSDNGLQVLKKDESNEGHAVESYSFKVCYGLRCK